MDRVAGWLGSGLVGSDICIGYRGRMSFFFQAEDGIRGPLWSRGLGDVYQRQFLYYVLLRRYLDTLYIHCF